MKFLHFFITVFIISQVNVGGKGISSFGGAKSGVFSGAGRSAGIGGTRGGGGFFRGASRTGGSYRGGRHWWILGAAGLYGGGGHYRSGRYYRESEPDANSNLTESSELLEEPPTEYYLIGASGFLYAVFGLAFMLYRSSFKPEKYHQGEFTLLHFLVYACLSSFMIIAYNIPTGPEYEEDSWDTWFDVSSTKFIENGGSPLNYFDLFFCGTGMLISTLILIDVCRTSGAFCWNLTTKTGVGLFAICLVTSLVIPIFGSWSYSLILFSVTALLIAKLRYVGLFFAHHGERISAEDSLYYWNPKQTKKYKRLNTLELLSGICNVVFHGLMTYDDCSLAYVNSAIIGIGILAVIFDSIFLGMLLVGPRKRPPAERYSCDDPL